MEYADFKMVTKVTSAKGKPIFEFTTWRADFIEQALAAMELNKIAIEKAAKPFRIFIQYTLGENEINDEVLRRLPLFMFHYSENFEIGDHISVLIMDNEKKE